MRSKIEDPIVLEAIRLQFGTTLKARHIELEEASVLAEAFQYSEKWLGYRSDLYLVPSWLPAVFALDANHTKAIVVSSGYLKMLGKFRRIYCDPKLSSSRRDIVEMQFLETTAYHCLREGNPDIGALLFQKSLNARETLIEDPPLFNPLIVPIDEGASALTQGLFSLVHEVGHTNIDLASVHPNLEFISHSAITSRIERAMDAMSWATADVRKRLLNIARENPKTHILGPSNLRREAYSDAFAAQRLLTFAADLTSEQGVKLDPFEFFRAVVCEFQAITAMQHTRFAARTTRDYPPEPDFFLTFLAHPIAMSVRLDLLGIALLGFARSLTIDGTIKPWDDSVERWFRVNDDLVSEEPELTQGIDRAFTQVVNASTRDEQGVFTETLSTLRRSRYARMDTGTFIATAESLNVSTTTIGILKQLVKDPANPKLDNVEDVRSSYHMLIAHSPHYDNPRLISIPLSALPSAIIVFTSTETAAKWISGFVDRYLKDDETIDLLTRHAYHPEDLLEFIQEFFTPKFTMVVEGTRAFERFDIKRKMFKQAKEMGNDSRDAGISNRSAEAIADRYHRYVNTTINPATLDEFSGILRLVEDL